MLKALGFRYSNSRDAYILRVVGRRVGPVFQEPAETAGTEEELGGRATR